MMREAEKERVITFPLHEFCAVVESYLTPNHPVYQFVFKHYKEQILKGFGLDGREEDV
jgi:hypothetical protein